MCYLSKWNLKMDCFCSYFFLPFSDIPWGLILGKKIHKKCVFNENTFFSMVQSGLKSVNFNLFKKMYRFHFTSPKKYISSALKLTKHHYYDPIFSEHLFRLDLHHHINIQLPRCKQWILKPNIYLLLLIKSFLIKNVKISMFHLVEQFIL